MNQNIQSKVCLLAAGKGTRFPLDGIHKAFAPINKRAAISIILDKIPEETEIVIATNYLEEQLKEYLYFAHPNRIFTFIHVDKIEGDGTGPGYSLLQCKSNLQCPFYFLGVDTILDLRLTPNNQAFNLITLLYNKNINLQDHYIKYNLVTKKFGKYEQGDIFTGAAFIKDYKEFWDALEHEKTKQKTLEVWHGLQHLENLTPIYPNWNDTGNIDAYRQIKGNQFKTLKQNQSTLIEKNNVIKIFNSTTQRDAFIDRTEFLPNNCLPKEIKKIGRFIATYKKINGVVLTNDLSDKNIDQVFETFLSNFRVINTGEVSLKFFVSKTLQRINMFLQHYEDIDYSIQYINDIQVYPVSQMLNQIDLNSIERHQIPHLFHGDFQPDNIIINDKGEPIFIDWRISYHTHNDIGDLYYDLSKFYHALPLISGQTKVTIDNKKAFIEYSINNNLLNCAKKMKNICIQREFDYKKIVLMGILHYLNIAPLYIDEEYSKFLFLLGKYHLAKYIVDHSHEVV